MNKLLAKLLAVVLALAVSASLVVMSTYAWFTMSGAPEVGGIQVNIGGGNTILIASDIAVENEDGTVSHYPGEFSAVQSFSGRNYAYLQDVAALQPVSTADGLHWVTQGSGMEEYVIDTELSRANQQTGSAGGGNYVYLDLWVVSPGASYDLRVSTGNDEELGGSYVIGLMEPYAVGDTYALVQSDATAANCVRIGFLTNDTSAGQEAMMQYTRSEDYDSRYTRLKGSYQEPGDALEEDAVQNSRFTIYEPNGDLHAQGGGSGYRITQPLAVVDGAVMPADISDRLSVQLTNHWKTTDDSLQTLLQQEFAAALAGRDLTGETEQSLWNYFYKERMQSQLAAYVNKGGFVSSTQNLYAAAQNGTVAQDAVALHMTGGATEDVYITTLEKNVPQRIRVFIWIEGQDEDCRSLSGISGFTMSLELAGSSK